MSQSNITSMPDMKLELVPLPVSDVDRARAFYVEKLGFHADHDVKISDTMRVCQLTPPGSACSIVIGTGIGTDEMQPGSIRGLIWLCGTWGRYVKSWPPGALA